MRDGSNYYMLRVILSKKRFHEHLFILFYFVDRSPGIH